MGALRNAGIGTEWYAMRVEAGTEDAVCSFVRRAMADATIDGECVIPKCLIPQSKTREAGSLQELLPGCVLVGTNDIDDLTVELKRSSALRRISGKRVALVPLSDDIAEWVNSCVHVDDCTFGMSEGYDEHGKVTVTSGPLKGREAMIRKTNHRKKLAYIRIPLFGEMVEAEMGLRLVRK